MVYGGSAVLLLVCLAEFFVIICWSWSAATERNKESRTTARRPTNPSTLTEKTNTSEIDRLTYLKLVSAPPIGMCLWTNVKRKLSFAPITNHQHRFLQALDETGFQYSMVYGSLLGAYRNEGWIPKDNDIDIAVFYHLSKHLVNDSAFDPSIKIMNLRRHASVPRYILPLEYSLVNRLIKTKAFQGLEVNYLDFFDHNFHIVLKGDNGLMDMFPASYPPVGAGGFCHCFFSTVKTRCFKNTDAILRRHYGVKFMTPSETKVWRYDMNPLSLNPSQAEP